MPALALPFPLASVLVRPGGGGVRDSLPDGGST